MPTSVTLRHGRSEATLLPSRGGLLSQLTLHASAGGDEPVPLLWMPDTFSPTESGWPGGGMPLLFPLAGRQFHGDRSLHYALGERTYHMPLHGFAYALPWALTGQQEHLAELTLRSGPATYQLFPFDFTVVARYTLAAATLTLDLWITNDGGRDEAAAPMPLAMGAHPYFHAPLGANSSLAQCHLETSATSKTRVTPVGTAGKSAPYPESAEEAKGTLTSPLLRNLILGEHAAGKASLVDDGCGRKVQLSWSDGFRYLVLWSLEGKGFHCIEPWMGLPDALHHGDGLRWLRRGECYSLSMQLALEHRTT
ncbi:MAG: hypothetical protein NTZ90_10830 [Proteobacteria bacterium]|nr:hypothetical protein [Pseudomonadota bacterium]